MIATPGLVPQRMPRASIHWNVGLPGASASSSLLRVEDQRQQVAPAELLQRIEVEADDVGGRDEPGIHAAPDGSGAAADAKCEVIVRKRIPAGSAGSDVPVSPRASASSG